MIIFFFSIRSKDQQKTSREEAIRLILEVLCKPPSAIWRPLVLEREACCSMVSHSRSINLALHKATGWQNKTALKSILQLIYIFFLRNLVPYNFFTGPKL